MLQRSISRTLLGALLLLVFSTVQAQQPALKDNLPFDPAVTTGKLANGLTYYIRKNNKPEQKVELRLVVNAGSLLETDAQQGLAHMGEHMAFNGTKNFQKNEIISFLQSIGVGFGNDLNAFTSFDQTVYILPIPVDKPGNLETGFQILEDWAHNVSYLDEDINEERPIILEEARMGKGAQDRIMRKVLPGMLAGSRYADRLPIGKDSIIKNFDPQLIRNFYHDWYRPDLMAVIVVGDVDPAKALQLVKQHFAGIKNPANEKKRVEFGLPPYKEDKAIVVTDPEATGYNLEMYYPAFKEAPETTVGDYRAQLVRGIFTLLLNQRLQELTQASDPPFLRAGASFGSMARGYNGFTATVNTGTGDIVRGLKALTTEIERVKKFGFTETELERARKIMESFYERMYNNRDKTESAQYVDEYVSNFLEHEPAPGIAKEYEYAKALLPGITLAEVNAVADVIKGKQNRFMYVSAPDPKAGETLPTGAALLAIADAAEKADITPYKEEAVASSLLPQEPKAGKVVFRKEDKVLGTTELTLSNGIKVTLKSTDFKNDQILMAATRPGGQNQYDVADKYNAAYAVPVVATMGIGQFTPTELKKALAGKTVSVSPYMSANTEGVQGSSSDKDLETMLQLTYLYFTAPRKDTALFKSFIQRNKSQYAMLSANPQAAFIDTLYQVMYANNPLAPINVPHSEYFDHIDLDRAMAIYKEQFGDAAGMNFVLVGSFDVSQMVPLIEKYIGSLPATGKKAAYVDNKVRPISGENEIVVNKGKEEKSLIVAMYTGETEYSASLSMSMQAMSEVLNIRIIEELREKIQGIYGGGTKVSLEKIPYDNYTFLLQLPCGPAKVDTLVKAVKKEFEDLANNGPDEATLNKVKKQWVEQYKTAVKQNETWLGKLLTMKQQGGDPERFTEFEKYVDALTVKDVQQAAKIVFQGGHNAFWAILMPEKL